MNVNARKLAAFIAVSPRLIGRFEQAGVLEHEHNGQFDLRCSVQRLLIHLYGARTLGIFTAAAPSHFQ